MVKIVNFGVFGDFRDFRLHTKQSIRGHPLHIFQKKHKTTTILVLEDVDGQFEIPLLYFYDTASCLGCPTEGFATLQLKFHLTGLIRSMLFM